MGQPESELYFLVQRPVYDSELSNLDAAMVGLAFPAMYRSTEVPNPQPTVRFYDRQPSQIDDAVSLSITGILSVLEEAGHGLIASKLRDDIERIHGPVYLERGYIGVPSSIGMLIGPAGKEFFP